MATRNVVMMSASVISARPCTSTCSCSRHGDFDTCDVFDSGEMFDVEWECNV